MNSPSSNNAVAKILALLGSAVLIPVPTGSKSCQLTGWRGLTLDDMGDPTHLGKLNNCNIAVAVGTPSSGLCSIDIDDDTNVEPFLKLNPSLGETLRTKGARGCNIWCRITGEIPRLQKIYHCSSRNENNMKLLVGEWRADGGLTMIHGLHPSGKNYERIVDNPPVEIGFNEIIWPVDWTVPEIKSSKSLNRSDGNWPNEMIVLPSESVSITETAEKLFTRIAPTETMFSRNGRIMEIVNNSDGSISLEVVTPDAFRSRIEQHAEFFVWRKGRNNVPVLQPTSPTADNANALMASLAAQTLPPVKGVINCPVLVANNERTRVVSAGYDSTLRLIVTGGQCPPEVQLQDAVTKLLEIISDFNFQTEGDRSRGIASLIGPALKMGGHLNGKIPVDMAEADQSQSGKTFRQVLVAAAYNEVPSMVTQRQGGVGSDDELFNQQLVKGKPFILFDNRRGKLDSAHIEAFLTCRGLFPARVPYSGTINVDADFFYLFLSSNGVETTPDMANRSIITRIRKRPQNYKYLAYEEGNVLQHVQANQAYILGCIFAVVREWLEHGKPRTDECRHDFRDYVQTLDWIVKNIFGLAGLMDDHQAAQQRVSNPAQTFARKLAIAIAKSSQLKTTFTALELYQLAIDNDIDVPGLNRIDDDAGCKVVGAQMKRLFSDGNEVQIEGFRFAKTTKDVKRDDGNGYRQQFTYSFKTITSTNINDDENAFHRHHHNPHKAV